MRWAEAAGRPGGWWRMARLKTMVSFLERNFWLSVMLLAGLLLLFAAAVAGFGGRLPPLKPLPRAGVPPSELLPPAQVDALFSTNALPSADVPTNAMNPFYTLYFQPPPPPPTKKVALLYQGCFESSRGVRLGYVRLGEALLVLTNGAKVVADHFVQSISVQALSLTNAAGQTNLLKFNTPSTLEVPAS